MQKKGKAYFSMFSSRLNPTVEEGGNRKSPRVPEGLGIDSGLGPLGGARFCLGFRVQFGSNESFRVQGPK